jgi:uncharacterized membrane protein
LSPAFCHSALHAFNPYMRDTPEAEAHVIRTARMFENAGQHFNRGQRALFVALGYLGCFVGPWLLFVATLAVVISPVRLDYPSIHRTGDPPTEHAVNRDCVMMRNRAV